MWASSVSHHFHERLADEVLGQQPDDEDEDQRQQRADTRQVEAKQTFRLPGARQQIQGLVHRADHEAEYPQRDRERHQDQQPRQEIRLERDFLGCLRCLCSHR